MATEQHDELITVREAAKECGRNMETVRRWIWGGKLPAQKLGNQLFIKKSDLASYCREMAVKPYDARARNHLTEDEIVETIHKMREERMNQIEQSLQDWKRETETRQKDDSLERAIAFRERLRARGYPETDTAALVKKSRDGRMRELRQGLRRR